MLARSRNQRLVAGVFGATVIESQGTIYDSFYSGEHAGRYDLSHVFSNHFDLVQTQLRIHRQRDELARATFGNRKSAPLISKIAIGRLQMDWYRIVNSASNTLIG